MKKCDACKKRAEGLGTYPTEFKKIVLCSDCYEDIFPNGRKYRNETQLQANKERADKKMAERGDHSVIVENVDAWFEEQFQKIKEKKTIEEAMKGAESYLMTTCHELSGYQIVQYHGVVSGESVLGTGFLSSWDASISDMFGEESNAFIDKLSIARKNAMRRAVQAGIQAGGNALIGIDIEYTMFTDNLIGVIVTGTSVTVQKNSEANNAMESGQK